MRERERGRKGEREGGSVGEWTNNCDSGNGFGKRNGEIDQD